MPLKLLIVDDQPGIAAVVERIAIALGYDTRVIRNPLDATEAFLDLLPDAVVLDIVMPEKDGLDLLEEMILTGHPTKFIVMSGHGDTYLRLAEGVARFHGSKLPTILRKPFRRSELAAILRGFSLAHSAHDD